jgi:aerobic C4-dicarboxylate transport protein
MHWLKKLYVQVILGMILGITLAAISPETGVDMKPLGDGFIKLIKMVIAPIIFCTVVTGIAHVGDIKKAGKLGLKALIWFEVITTIALVMGLVIGNLSGIGIGMNVDMSSIDASALKSYTQNTEHHGGGGMTDFLMALIPQSFFMGVVNGDLLQTLTAAILFAWAMMGLGEHGAVLLKGIDALSHVFFRIVGIVMLLAPIGAFGAMAYTIGKFGVGSIGELAGFMGMFFATCIGLSIAVLGSTMKFYVKLSFTQLLKYMKDELLIVLGTSSSESVLPRVLEKMEEMGCERQVVGMVLPTGYSFNLFGSCIYFTMAVVFLANATNTHLDMSQQISIMMVMLITSKGSAGVSGAAFIVLVGTLAAVGTIPVQSAALILGIDRFMSTGRALTNLIGNCVTTLAVARWENALDIDLARKVISGKVIVHGDTETVLLSDTPKATHEAA